MNSPIRLCEGGKVSHELKSFQRAEIEFAAESWRENNRLRQAPLWFSGAQSQTLCAAQNLVGVVEAGGVTIEILPKLDAALLDENAAPDERKAETVLSHLMWMLEVSAHDNLAQTDSASLPEEPSSFFDVWAFLLGRNLLRELENGVARTYQNHADDLRAVRGRIRIAHQVTRNWNRLDFIACDWDEFTPDTPLNRAFKCCLRFLQTRVRALKAFQVLESCLMFLDDVCDVDAATALHETAHFRWDRNTLRFARAFELARRLLKSQAHALGAGNADTFVFLVDMAQVFEKYCGAVLSAHYECEIETQKNLGKLFKLEKSGISQIADYFWQAGSTLHIGDAKYKHLAKRQNAPLRFEDFSDDENEESQPLAGRIISAADVRQLTVYAELAKAELKKDDLPTPAEVRLLLLYPFVGMNPRRATETTWNDAQFSLVPVCLHRRTRVADCLPEVRGELADTSTGSSALN